MLDVTGRAAVGLCAASLLPGVVACAETTIDPSVTAPSSVEATTTVFAPTGSTEALLAEILTESGRLSDLIVVNEGQDEALARIDARWAAVADDVASERDDLLSGFESAMGLLHTAVERRRPADADKAYNNLRMLFAAYTSG